MTHQIPFPIKLFGIDEKDVIFQIVGEMFAGDSFGELALLHDIKRAATIICKGTAEFLTIDKPDFDMVRTYFKLLQFSYRD